MFIVSCQHRPLKLLSSELVWLCALLLLYVYRFMTSSPLRVGVILSLHLLWSSHEAFGCLCLPRMWITGVSGESWIVHTTSSR